MIEFDILTSIYSKFFGVDFNGKDFDQRLLMQKIIYLLSEKGIDCGDYKFIWYKHGPFSNNLHLSIYEISNSDYVAKEVRLDVNTITIIDLIKNLETSKPLFEGVDYNKPSWYEALASIHYLKNYYFPSMGKEELLNILENFKSHLNNRKINEFAYEIIKSF